MTEENDETKQAIKAVDDMEDEAAAKRNKASEEHKEEENPVVIICPKCKLLVNESDFNEDELSKAFDTSIISKINCTNCGYSGLPIEISREEYANFVKNSK